MPKVKSHSGLKKRVKRTAKGKIRMQKSCKQHLLINKSSKAKGKNKGGQATSKGNEKNIRKLLPYFNK